MLRVVQGEAVALRVWQLTGKKPKLLEVAFQCGGMPHRLRQYSPHQFSADGERFRRPVPAIPPHPRCPHNFLFLLLYGVVYCHHITPGGL